MNVPVCVSSYFRIWNMQMRWQFFACTMAPTCFHRLNGMRRPSSDGLKGGASSNTNTHKQKYPTIHPPWRWQFLSLADRYLYFTLAVWTTVRLHICIFEELLKIKVKTMSCAYILFLTTHDLWGLFFILIFTVCMMFEQIYVFRVSELNRPKKKCLKSYCNTNHKTQCY